MSRLLLIILLACTVASAIGVVFVRHRHRQTFIELSRAERKRDDINRNSAVCSWSRPRWPKPTVSIASPAKSSA